AGKAVLVRTVRACSSSHGTHLRLSNRPKEPAVDVRITRSATTSASRSRGSSVAPIVSLACTNHGSAVATPLLHWSTEDSRPNDSAGAGPNDFNFVSTAFDERVAAPGIECAKPLCRTRA